MAARETTTRRLLLLATVLGAVLAAGSARPQRVPEPGVPRPHVEPPPVPEPQPVTYGNDLHRPVLLLAVLAATAVVSVWSAHQQRQADGALVAGLGFGAIAAAVWAVAYWRGDLWPDEGFARLSFGMFGLLLLALSGPALVTELTLTERGKPVAAEVAPARLTGEYRLVVPGKPAPLPGDLRTKTEFAGGERTTALADPARFVRPMPRDEVNPALDSGFVLAGTGVLAVALLSLGSAGRPRRSS
ncbi:hypothetical protein ILP97_31430 [Amycolatopsis sp. H6(2020)]|nr:hypothetical protein [Amycolatopsis sp. H6(2020)]